MEKLIITDVTLRDGSHGISHQLRATDIAKYCQAAESCGIPIVEVGHGNGLGASSALIGFSLISDEEMLLSARENLKESKLGIHAIPGLATRKKDLQQAVEIGVDSFRIASHCTEADTTKKHIEFVRNSGREAVGVLMMSHMTSPIILGEQAKLMVKYGATSILIMDSAGAFLPEDVSERIKILCQETGVAVGFHAHNNLGMGIANNLAAVKSGATKLDGCARGLGAGAGNAQIEVLVPVLHKYGYETGINQIDLLDAADIADENFAGAGPTISSLSLISGLNGVFSGFVKPVLTTAKEYGVDAKEIFIELGRRKVVAGQENLIIEIAQELLQRDSTL
jgi:4-hydroxy 2-oxovalerate aldolase